jgi:N-acetyl sugar amidotransferase
MEYCKLCLENTLRPNTKFYKGICPACNYLSSIKNINWSQRYDVLLSLIKKYRNKKNQFDCIVGVSGGKDSTRQALWIKEKLGLRPLLVSLTYPPEQVSERGVNNISNLINLGFDMVISAPAPLTWRNLLKESFLKFTNWAKSTELALFSSVPQVAIKYGINLIFWGENPGLQVGDMASSSKNQYDGKNLRNLNTLSGGSGAWIEKKKYKDFQLIPYSYPDQNDFKTNKIKIIYLGWFLGDWSLSNNAMRSISYGLKIRENKFKNYGDLLGISSLDEDWVTINQLIKYYKYGFGRASEYMNDEIRLSRIIRDKAAKIAAKYDGKFSEKIILDFCNYINITEDKFWKVVKKNLNKNIFKIENNKIIPKFITGKNY